VLGRTYDTQICSAARALEVVGDRWSLLIVRDALFSGATRFSEFERSLGIAPNVLARRLQSFVETGIMEGRSGPGEETSPRYWLTEKGRDLAGVVVALTAWGDRWAAPNGPPVVFHHHGCGGTVGQELTCSQCERVTASELEARPGPGLSPSEWWTDPGPELRTSPSRRGPQRE
jgi:DNA-binding HxlR family transcriptional regulator